MPTRTVFPTISITCTTTSSPTMIFSPTRRVMSSMIPPWIYAAACFLGWVLRGGRDGGREERGADGSVGGLVDDLVALALGDEDRGAQVGEEVAQLGAGADRHPHDDVGRVARDRLGSLVGELDLVVGEEL